MVIVCGGGDGELNALKTGIVLPYPIIALNFIWEISIFIYAYLYVTAIIITINLFVKERRKGTWLSLETNHIIKIPLAQSAYTVNLWS